MVRAVIANPDDRPGFEEWYEKQHLPDALKAFDCEWAWRSWSKSDASVHIAFYEFTNIATTESSTTAAVPDLEAEFDHVWGDKVTRTREELDVVSEISS